MTIRPSTLADLTNIIDIQSYCYKEVTPENSDVLAEKLVLYPQGCFVAEEDSSTIAYMFSHPWKLASPVKINSFLGKIPNEANCYYIHDIAIHPSYRGYGIAKKLFNRALENALEESQQYIALVAVQNSESFWNKLGFRNCTSLNIEIGDVNDILGEYQEGAVFMLKDC